MDVELITERALALLKQHNIPSTPDNFAVWYCYVDKSRPELVAHLDQLIKESQVFTEALCTELYWKYIGSDIQETLLSTSSELQRIVNHASDNISAAGSFLSDYNHDLNTKSQSLDETKDTFTIKGFVAGLISLTQAAASKAAKTHRSLTVLNEDISELKLQVAQLTAEAYLDPLTTVANRRHFDKTLANLVRTGRAVGTHFSLLIIDIDDFKLFNDKYGHKVGDLVLRFMGKSLTKYTKGQDVVARYGGEEFAVLLPDTGCQNAEIFANQLREKIGKHQLTIGKNKRSIGTIKVSIGIAEFRDLDSEDSLFDRADKCLYLAKSQGKNCVVSETAL